MWKNGKGSGRQITIILVCIASLLTFEVFFLINAYEQARQEFTRDARRNLFYAQKSLLDSLKFDNTVRQLVDVIVSKEGFPPAGPGDSQKVSLQAFSDFPATAKFSVKSDLKGGNAYAFSFSTNDDSSLAHIVDSITNQFKSQKGRQLKITTSTSTQFKRGEIPSPSRGSRRDMIFEVDTAFMMRQLMARVDSGGPNFNYSWRVMANDSDKNHFFPHKFVLAGDDRVKLDLSVDGIDEAALGSILPEFIICLLLLAMVSISLILFHRNSERQRKLILLKNELISNISHELKTPVSSVKIALESVQRRLTDTDERTKDYLNKSEDEVGRLQYLIDKVLQSSMMEEGQLKLQTQKVNLPELIENCHKQVVLLAEEKNVAFDLPLPSEITVSADPDLLCRALNNVLENAIKYGPSSSTVKIQLKEAQQQVIIQVQDQGKGVPEGYIKSIFDRFFRMPNHDIHNVKGHGLGLHFVKSVIEKHGGTVSAKNLNPGFSIQIKLPNHG